MELAVLDEGTLGCFSLAFASFSSSARETLKIGSLFR
jgi:hypothetical protein